MKGMSIKELRKKCIKERSLEKKPINVLVIQTFYENPQLFFTQFKKAIKYSSYFDVSGISIFMHYLYLLYEDHRNSKKTLSKKFLINEKILSNINIYQNNFSQFVQEHREKLLVQDLCQETFFHKIAKFRDKTFFVKICEKLNTLEILNNQLLSIKNMNDETCCDFIFEEIKYKYDYYMFKDAQDYETLKDFVLMIKKYFSSSIYDPLPIDMKKILNNFILKNNFEIILKPNFSKLFNNIEDLFKKEKDINIFNYICLAFTSGINYLNVLYNLSKSSDDYNILFSFVNQITSITVKTIDKNKDNKKQDINMKDYCILDHINYALVKANSSKINGKQEVDYCIRLIKNTLKKILQDKDTNYITEILQSKKDYFKSLKESKKPPNVRNTMHNGLIFNLMLNNYLNFEQKLEILNVLNEVTHGLSEKQINEDFSMYAFYKHLKTSSSDIINLYDKDKNITTIINQFGLVIGLYDNLISMCDIYAKDSLDRYISLLNDFILQKNILPNYKAQYNFSSNNMQKVFQSILSFTKHRKDVLDKIPGINNAGELFFQFMVSDENLCKYYILDSLKCDDNFEALKLLFSFKYDFSELIDLHVKKLSFNYSKDLFDFLLESDNLEKNTNINLENKLVEKLKNIANPKSFAHYPSNKNYKKINAQKLHLLILYDVDFYISKMESFVFTNLNYLLNNWDKPVNYNKILNEIKDLIPTLLTYSRVEYNKFFLKNFLYLLFPDLIKDKIKAKSFPTEFNTSIDIIIDEKNKKRRKKQKNMYYYLMLLAILINVKIKFGNYNPELLYNICEKYNYFIKVFVCYMNSLQENIEKKEKVKHFFLTKKSSKEPFELQLKNYIYFNLNNLKEMKNSILLDFIKEMIESKDNKTIKMKSYISLINVPMNNNYILNYFIDNLVCNRIFIFDFLKEDHTQITDDHILNMANLLKYITQNCNERFSRQDYYDFSYVQKWINDSNKENIFMNLFHVLNVFKDNKISLFDSVSDIFLFTGITLTLFLNANCVVFKNYYNNETSKTKIDFILSEIVDFIVQFYNKYKYMVKSMIITNCFGAFYYLLEQNCYNKLKAANNKTEIMKEFNILKEVMSFLYEINNDNYFEEIQKENFDSKENNKKVKNQLNDMNIDADEYIINFGIDFKFPNKNINLSILEILLEKAPDLFQETVNIFRKYVKKNYIYYETNLLIKKMPTIALKYLLDTLSFINTTADDKIYPKNRIKVFLVKHILLLVDDISQIKKEINKDEKEIFMDKTFSMNLFRYSFDDKKIEGIINIIKNLYFEDKSELLFLDILKDNITNKHAFDYALSLLTEEQKQQIFTDNQDAIVKALYGYSEINGYHCIQELLNNLEKYIQDKNFIKNLIFQPKKQEEYNQMLEYFESKKIFESIPIENDEDNKENENKENENKENENKEEEKKENENKENIEDDYNSAQVASKKKKTKGDNNEKLDFNIKFLFNYSLARFRVPNHEVRALLFKYYSSEINLLNIFPIFLCLFKYHPSVMHIINYINHNSPNRFKNGKYYEKYKEEHNINVKNQRYHKIYSSEMRLLYNYNYEIFKLINDLKNKETIKTLNPTYFQFYELIEFIYTKAREFLQDLNSNEYMTFFFYIYIFVFKKVPYKLKRMLCTLKSDIYDFKSLRKENFFEDRLADINETELFIILALYEIKGEVIISVKEYFPAFCTEIENLCKKFKDLKFPEMNFKQDDDEVILQGFKNIITSDANNFITELTKHYDFYNLIFILEQKNNSLNNIKSLYNWKIFDYLYFEKALYNLLNNDSIDINNKDLTDDFYFILDFKTHAINIIENYTKAKENDTKGKRKGKSINYYCKGFLLMILNKCNFILRKNVNKNPFKLSILNSTVFSGQNKEKYDKMKSTILIKEIQKQILATFDNEEIENKTEVMQLLTNYMDYYLKDVNSLINEAENDSSNLMKYFKYLKINCLILSDFIDKVIYFNFENKENNRCKKHWKEDVKDNSNNSNNEELISKIIIKYNFKEESNNQNAIKSYNDSLISLEKEILSNLKGDKIMEYEVKEPITLYYNFDSEIKDYLNTYNNKYLGFFDYYMAWNFAFFVLNSYNKYNKLITKLHSEKKLLEHELSYLIFFNNKFGKKKMNEKIIPLLLKIYLHNCSFGKKFIVKTEDLIDVNKTLFSYYEKNQNDIDYIDYILNKEIKNNFYSKFYSQIYFNLVLFNSLYGYKNIIKTDSIIDLLKKNGFYFPKNIEESINLKKFVDEISNVEGVFQYETYCDFTELIAAIKKTKFHENKGLNSMFQRKAIDYIINKDSLLHILIHELINALFSIDNNYLHKLRANPFVIKVYEDNVASNSNNKKDTKKDTKKDQKKAKTKINSNANILANSASFNTNILSNFLSQNNKKLKYKVKKIKIKIEDSKVPLLKNSQTELNVLEPTAKAPVMPINKEDVEDVCVENNIFNYKFPGYPIPGYKGYIPQSKFFCGISDLKIIYNISSSGLYLSDFNKGKEKGFNAAKKGMGRINNEKIIIDCEESKKDNDKKVALKQNKLIKINFNLSNNENKSKKKGLNKIIKEYKELNDIYNTSIIDKTIQNAFCKIDENIDFLQYIYETQVFQFGKKKLLKPREKKELKQKGKNSKNNLKGKTLANTKRFKKIYFYHNRTFNHNDNYPNVFDSLFTIKKVGVNIEVTQNNISELLKPYLEEKAFQKLLDAVYPNKNKSDLPKIWRKYFNLGTICKTFGVKYIPEAYEKDIDRGVIKLHKEY